MPTTTKLFSERDSAQTLRASFNDADSSLSINGFLVGKVGRRVDVTYPNSSTEVYAFSENGTALYTYTIVYTDSTKESLSSAERTA